MSDDQTSRPGDPQRPVSEPTGVVDTRATQALPSSEPQAARPSAGEAHGDEPGWFESFDAQHPTQGPGVPARADSPWGSDRADALAEEAHRAQYTQPQYPEQYPTAPPTGAPVGPPDAAPVGAPVAAPSFGQYPPAPPAPGSGVPGAPAAAAPRRRRGLLVAGVAALCLASGVLGGVAGNLLDVRTPAGSSLPQPGPGATDRPAGSIANIAARALPSVVTIKVDAGADGTGTGSGFVIDDKGHVLTNNHVVAAGADSGVIQVLLSNGDTVDAKIVGRDVSYDLAVLKIGRTDLTPLRLGQSDKVVVGDQVIAVGAPLGLDQTVTTGIVSALNRPVTPGEGNEMSYINALQTDAAINPGNSGGPLLDLNGDVIGVNSAIARVPGTTGSAAGSIGVGFAIPSDQARRTAEQLIATGKATHPIIGVLLDRTFDGDGAQVRDTDDAVTPDGPAAKAGVQPGDIIVAFEGKPVRAPDQLIVSIRARAVGDTVTLKIERDGKQVDLRMTLEADPNS